MAKVTLIIEDSEVGIDIHDVFDPPLTEKENDTASQGVGRALRGALIECQKTINDWVASEKRKNERTSRYPCRCRVVDPTGEVKEYEEGTFVLNAPDKSKPKVGRTGWANLEPDGRNVRIKLDDGDELMGYECWWEPIADTN